MKTNTMNRVRLNEDTIEDICGELMTLQHVRRFCIRQQTRCNNAVVAFVRTQLGFSTDLPEAERKAISKRARQLIEVMEQGDLPRDERLTVWQTDTIYTIYASNVSARAPWDKLRAEQEASMKQLATQLPVYDWIKSVRGVRALGLAVIVGEVGDIGYNRQRPSGVWKRLGYSVEEDGYRQGRLPPGLSKDERTKAWKKRGYNPHRRAEAWAFLDDMLVRHQYQKGVVLGPYGEYYVKKKAEYLDRYANERAVKAHADKAARRYMAKMFLRDLWREWCLVVPVSESVGFV